MRRQWSLRVVLVMLGAALCLGGCGTKNKDTAETNGVTTEQNTQAPTNKNGVVLTSDSYNIGGYKIKLPEYRSELKYEIHKPSYGAGPVHIIGLDFMGSAEKKPFFIYASSYTKDSANYSGTEPVSDLDSCIDACASEINGQISGIQNYFLAPKVVITEQKRVTVNGREMLKAYGYVYSRDDGKYGWQKRKYGVIEYYTIIDKAQLSDGTKMPRQAFWVGLYGDDSEKAEMENYLDAMAESFEETEK